jgi:hypothetical protein
VVNALSGIVSALATTSSTAPAATDTDYTKPVTAAVAVFAFVVALLQYRAAQRWKKSEFAASQLDRLSTDWRLLLCTQFLDWYDRPFRTPGPYGDGEGKQSFNHNWEKLDRALAYGRTDDIESEAIIYRDCFSYFFDYLSRINHYIRIGLIRLQDVEDLRYWLTLIANPNYGPPDRNALKKFLETFEYAGVIELIETRFGLRLQDANSGRYFRPPTTVRQEWPYPSEWAGTEMTPTACSPLNRITDDRHQ